MCHNSILTFAGPQRVVPSLVVGAVSPLGLANLVGVHQGQDVEHLHDSVEQSVNQLET